MARRQGGFGYLLLLFAVALLGVGLAGAGMVWRTEAQRDKERELVFAGTQIMQAIASYYARSPGTVKQFPGSLQDLLEDRRFPFIVRHLRRLYRDPFTADGEWEVLREGGRVVGVASRSVLQPIGQPPEQVEIAGASGGTSAKDAAPASATRRDGGDAAGDAAPTPVRYRDWHFVYRSVAATKATAAPHSPK